MDAEEQRAVEEAQTLGVAVLRNVLSGAELQQARAHFDQAQVELAADLNVKGKPWGAAGTRDSLWGEKLLAYPAIAMIFSHPSLLRVIAAIMGERSGIPFLAKLKTNRSTPAEPGEKLEAVGKHTDHGGDEPATPFEQISTQVFLDDIDAGYGGGALLYSPGSHRRYFASYKRTSFDKPVKTEIDSGKYRPVELQAGSVVFRVPQVWHASVPIGRLRRYITGDYRRRTRLSVACREYINRVVETRQPADISTIPPAVQPLWTWSGETASL